MRSNLPRFTSKFIAWFLLHALLLIAARATTILSSTTEEFSAQRQTYTLAITSDTSWIASGEATWLSLSQTKGLGDAVLEIVIDENTTNVTRTAEITFDNEKLSITQQPRPSATTSSFPIASAAIATGTSAAEPAQTASALAAGQMTYHVDPSFALSTEILGGSVYVVAKTSDGGTLIGGEFSNINGFSRRGLAKLKADGTLDSAFNANGSFGGTPDVNGYGPHVRSLAVQADGRIVVGGYFSSFNGAARKNILRLNADGSLDTSFQPGSGFTGSTVISSSGTFDASNVSALALQSDGRILVSGKFKSFNGTACNYIARLNTDGSLDTSFASGTGFDAWNIDGAIAVQTDGRIIAGGYFTNYNGIARTNIARLNTDGSLDTTFDPGVSFSNMVQGLALQTDGRILAVGLFGSYRGVARSSIARLNTDASLDTTFDTTFAPTNGFNGGSGAAVIVQPDGRILVGGSFVNYNTVSRNNIARLNTDGTLDSTFNPGTGFGTDGGHVSSIALHADGRISAGGQFATFNGSPARNFARLNASGTFDMSFTDPMRTSTRIKSIAPLAGGKWLIGGDFTFVNGVTQGGIARLNADASVDDTFVTGTGFEKNYWGASVASVAVQPDNRVIVCGPYSSFNGTIRNGVTRLNTDGSLDPSFGTDAQFSGSSSTSILIQPDGRIVLGGGRGVGRLTATGVLDNTFQPGGPFAPISGWINVGSPGPIVSTFQLQSDGRIVVGQGFWNMSNSGITFFRLNADGSVDSTFQTQTIVEAINSHESPINLAIQPDGHIVVAGSFSTLGGTVCNGLARLNSNGSVDSNFTASGSFNGSVSALTLQTDGRPIVGGNFTQFASTTRTSLAGLNITGGLDTGFTVADTLVDPVYQLSRGDDSRLLLAGPSAYNSGVLQGGYVLLVPDSIPTFTLQPQSTSVPVGTNVTLTAKATGYPQVSYRWYRDGNLITNNTGDSLTIAYVTDLVAGSYTVVATNTNGSTTSTPAIVAAINNQTPSSDKGTATGGGGAISPWALLTLCATLLLRLRARR